MRTDITSATPRRQAAGAKLEPAEPRAAETVSTESGVSSAAAPDSASLGNELKQLAALHERGVLSDEEFAAAKRKLLA